MNDIIIIDKSSFTEKYYTGCCDKYGKMCTSEDVHDAVLFRDETTARKVLNTILGGKSDFSYKIIGRDAWISRNKY